MQDDKVTLNFKLQKGCVEQQKHLELLREQALNDNISANLAGQSLSSTVPTTKGTSTLISNIDNDFLLFCKKWRDTGCTSQSQYYALPRNWMDIKMTESHLL